MFEQARELLQSGRFEELRRLVERAAEPERPHLEAALHLAQGQPLAAVASARAAGSSPTARNTLAVALLTCGQRREAQEILGQLVEADPHNPDLWFNLARATCDPAAARRARELRPGWPAALVLEATLAESLELARQLPDNPEARLLEARLLYRQGRLQAAVAVCLEMLQEDIDCQSLLQDALRRAQLPDDRRVLPYLPLNAIPAALRRWPQEEQLLLRLLHEGLVSDLDMERDLTHRRRERQLSPELLEALAAHNFTNEFAFLEEPGEVPAVGDPYYPLYRPLPPGDYPSSPVVERHLEEPRREREWLARLAPLQGDRVAAQYAENPYPPWRSLEPSGPALPFHELFPGHQAPYAEPLRVLVAGCGTGRQALAEARRFQNCQVWGVDVSPPSLAYACRQAERLGIGNVDFRTGDLLDLPAGLPNTFEVIECVGVLHHLSDPVAGLRALRARLAPGGWMRLGFYSRLARQPLDPARRLARSLAGLPLREIRARLMRELAPEDLQFLAGLVDFYTLSGLRDLVLHEREAEYDLPQVAAMLGAAGLEFVTFEGLLPHRPLDRMDLWEEYEREHPRTFLGMYVFWARSA